MTSFLISWWVESRTRIEYWLKIDIRSSQNVEIEYSSWVRRLILSTQVESEDWYWNSTWWSVYLHNDLKYSIQDIIKKLNIKKKFDIKKKFNIKKKLDIKKKLNIKKKLDIKKKSSIKRKSHISMKLHVLWHNLIC